MAAAAVAARVAAVVAERTVGGGGSSFPLIQDVPETCRTARIHEKRDAAQSAWLGPLVSPL